MLCHCPPVLYSRAPWPPSPSEPGGPPPLAADSEGKTAPGSPPSHPRTEGRSPPAPGGARWATRPGSSRRPGLPPATGPGSGSSSYGSSSASDLPGHTDLILKCRCLTATSPRPSSTLSLAPSSPFFSCYPSPTWLDQSRQKPWSPLATSSSLASWQDSGHFTCRHTRLNEVVDCGSITFQSKTVWGIYSSVNSQKRYRE